LVWFHGLLFYVFKRERKMRGVALSVVLEAEVAAIREGEVCLREWRRVRQSPQTLPRQSGLSHDSARQSHQLRVDGADCTQARERGE
jgi:hypothetical protein